jgi:SAM-dependent methyltransferase
MYRAESCPCCASTEHVAYAALVSPFVSAYVLGETPPPTRLLECGACGFRFFEDRLTDDEAARLYADYRGDRYYAERHRREPWYTRRVNDAIGGDPEGVAARRELIERVLRDHGDVAALERVLDFGGDRGQVIPDAVGREKFVYEISGTHPVAGVARIGSADELRGRRFDLVLLCHVLEHCSEPGEVLEQIRPLLAGPDARLYVEVPYERADLRWVGRGGAYGAWLSALRRVPPLLTAVDFYSTLFRIKAGVLPPLGFVKLHEHVNFFDAASLRALLERCGFEAIVSEKVDMALPSGLSSVLVALARLRP